MDYSLRDAYIIQLINDLCFEINRDINVAEKQHNKAEVKRLEAVLKHISAGSKRLREKYEQETQS